MPVRIALATLILLCAVISAGADEVRLANGDRLTGRVVSLAGGTLTFSTPNGDLRIPWATVTELTVDEPILATIGTADPAPVTGRIAIAGVQALARPRPAVTVDGGANAGFVTSDGNTEVTSLRLDGDAVIRQRANRYTAAAAINRAEDKGVETARNWNTGFNYDRFLTERLFVNGNAIFTNDEFRDLDLRTALGVGLGYQVLNTPRARLTANAGVGWVDENFEAGQDDSYTAARESASLEIDAVPDRIRFFHQHDGYFGVTGDDNLFFRTRNGVRVGLFGGLVTTLQHDVDYDRTPSPGRRNTDRTLALTFGYRF